MHIQNDQKNHFQAIPNSCALWALFRSPIPQLYFGIKEESKNK
jgi:hypothetical protein